MISLRAFRFVEAQRLLDRDPHATRGSIHFGSPSYHLEEPSAVSSVV